MSGTEVRDAMLGTALEMVYEHGLTVSLDHISMDAIVAASGVARSAAYRVWPRREEFINDLLLQLAASPQASPVVYDPPTLQMALNALIELRDGLTTPESRRRILIEVCRIGAITNFEDIRQRNTWQTHMALSATVLSYPEEYRKELQDAINQASSSYVDGMAEFYDAMALALGFETIPGIDFRYLAAVSSALMEGMVLRSLTVYDGRAGLPDLVRTFTADPFKTGDEREWNAAAISFTSNLLALSRPSGEITSKELDQRLEKVRQAIARIEAEAEESKQWLTQ
ncbi:hypothetical protein ONR57_12935 [Hoyosella sp. YIM 151337]|uniref:TetR/AcrR family transcriptional regulator n=1 Tax=Hoyosella sp. YIM 151337 TaxID=2992742 RepID=UPI0022366B41|nr:hypothetical protein [Hoyosella sp. YIM 151337]MCW4354205.1 hypothetical protein [Hoyosella sp. YIM 151337]